MPTPIASTSQGVEGLVRHHAVVDHHREDRAGDRERVEQQRRDDDFQVDRREREHAAPEPRPRRRASPGRSSGRPCGSSAARRSSCRCSGRRDRARRRGWCRRRFSGVAISASLPSTRRRKTQAWPSFSMRNAGQRQSRDGIELAPRHAGGQADAVGGVDEEFRRDSARRNRQAGRQGRRRLRHAVDARHDDEAEQQRVVPLDRSVVDGRRLRDRRNLF